MNGQTHNEHNTMTIACWPSANGAKNDATKIYPRHFTTLEVETFGRHCVNSLPNDKVLDSSKRKEFADDNFKFDENGRKLSKQVENTVICINFSFSQCFLPCMALIFSFKCTSKCHLQICFNLDQSKILSSGNG